MFLEDVYRFGEDYLCDIADTLEAEVLRICEEKLKRARTRVVRKDGAGAGGAGAGAAGKAAGGGGPTDSALNAEVAAGVDAVWETMVQAYELVGDQFEAYAMRNVFAWPEGLEVTASSGEALPYKMYPVGYDAAVATRVTALEEKVMKERKKLRTLMHIKGLLGKRVPQAESAAKLLEEVMSALQMGGESPPGESFPAFFSHAARLTDLCNRLSSASPAAAQAIKEKLLASEEDDSVGREEGGEGGEGEDILASFTAEKTATGARQ